VAHARRLRSGSFVFIASLLFLLALIASSIPIGRANGDEKKSADPWPSSQKLEPAQLAKMLVDKYSSVPAVVFVGFRSLYVGGHIPDASFHGTASTEQGLAELKAWAATLPRSTDLVIYCGCCPFDKCPNIRPAYTALNSMGFKNVRVLVLPTSFAVDWADKGYAIQKGMKFDSISSRSGSHTPIR
jgi:thiosulfate/3-mercaptopyruvate sulfurtransferase